MKHHHSIDARDPPVAIDTNARIVLALIIVASATAFVHALWVGTVTDDAGIALAYARTFASGQGLRLTPFSARVEAYSDPLWVLWLALGYLLHIDGPTFAHVSGAAFGAAAVFLTGMIPSLAEGRKLILLDAVAPGLLAVDTTYNYWAGAGLETGAFACALAATLALIASGSRWSTASAGLLAVLRPEGALYVVLVAPFAKRRGRSIVWIIRWLALAGLPATAWLAFRVVYYGQWLPNAFFAKRALDYGGIAYLRDWFAQDWWHWVLCLSPVALLVPRTRRIAALAFVTCSAGAMFILFSRGDWMIEHRFVGHALPAVALSAGLVCIVVDDVFELRPGKVVAVALFTVACISAPARSAHRRLNPEMPLTYVADQGRWFRNQSRRLGLVHPRIAHFDIGGIALESGGEVIDLAGIGDLYIGRIGYHADKAVCDYIFNDVKPDMINIHGPSAYLDNDPRLRRDYLAAASGLWGENWIRKPLLRGLDDRCPSGRVPHDIEKELSIATAAEARDLWLCARAHMTSPPAAAALAQRFAAVGLNEPTGNREDLDAAATLDPAQIRAAQRLLNLRLQR